MSPSPEDKNKNRNKAAAQAAIGRASPLQLDLANQIMRSIRDGVIAPGEHLTEQSLAQQMGVSRSPVRAAFKLLEQRGYLESRANAGVTVCEQLPEEADEGGFEVEGMTEDGLYRELITARAQGRLPDVFSEAELLSRYEVTRSVLLRTLLRMSSEDLVARRKGNGWGFQPALSSTEAKQESYRFRMLVECGGVRETSFKSDADALARARAAHERFLRTPSNEQSSTDFIDMNSSFHEMLAEFSGNQFILQAVRSQNRLRRLEEYRRHANNPINVENSCQEHLRIIEALEQGDTDLAALLLHRHLSMASQF